MVANYYVARLVVLNYQVGASVPYKAVIWDDSLVEGLRPSCRISIALFRVKAMGTVYVQFALSVVFLVIFVRGHMNQRARDPYVRIRQCRAVLARDLIGREVTSMGGLDSIPVFQANPNAQLGVHPIRDVFVRVRIVLEVGPIRFAGSPIATVVYHHGRRVFAVLPGAGCNVNALANPIPVSANAYGQEGPAAPSFGNSTSSSVIRLVRAHSTALSRVEARARVSSVPTVYNQDAKAVRAYCVRSACANVVYPVDHYLGRYAFSTIILYHVPARIVHVDGASRQRYERFGSLSVPRYVILNCNMYARVVCHDQLRIRSVGATIVLRVIYKAVVRCHKIKFNTPAGTLFRSFASNGSAGHRATGDDSYAANVAFIYRRGECYAK